MLFIHVQQQTRTERENDREKKRLDTHTELFIQWIKCRHRWLDVDIDSLFTIFFPSFSLNLFEKITFELILACSKGFIRLFSSKGQKEKDESKVTYRIQLNRRKRKKERKKKKVNFVLSFSRYTGTKTYKERSILLVFTYQLSV